MTLKWSYNIFKWLTTQRIPLYLRHYATSWKVAGSLPHESIDSIGLTLPAALTGLGSTEPVTEMSTRDVQGLRARKADLICEIVSHLQGWMDTFHHISQA
jgi:hypothetical protein